MYALSEPHRRKIAATQRGRVRARTGEAGIRQRPCGHAPCFRLFMNVNRLLSASALAGSCGGKGEGDGCAPSHEAAWTRTTSDARLDRCTWTGMGPVCPAGSRASASTPKGRLGSRSGTPAALNHRLEAVPAGVDGATLENTSCTLLLM